MATRLQRRAFRKNAKRSTGPRTPEGKARSSQNARKHGLFARDAVLPGENPEEFLQLIADLEQELEAGSPFECRLVCHIAATEWRMLRLVRLETGALMSQLEKERLYAQRVQAGLGELNQSPQAEHGEQNAPPPAGAPVARGSERPAAFLPCHQSTKELGAVVAEDRDTPVLLTLSLYESRLTRKYLNLLKQLRFTQKLRRAAEAAEPEPLLSETETRPPATECPPAQYPPTPAAGQVTPTPSSGQLTSRTPVIEPQPRHPPAPTSARASPQEAAQEQAEKPAPRVA